MIASVRIVTVVEREVAVAVAHLIGLVRSAAAIRVATRCAAADDPSRPSATASAIETGTETATATEDAIVAIVIVIAMRNGLHHRATDYAVGVGAESANGTASGSGRETSRTVTSAYHRLATNAFRRLERIAGDHAR